MSGKYPQKSVADFLVSIGVENAGGTEDHGCQGFACEKLPLFSELILPEHIQFRLHIGQGVCRLPEYVGAGY